MGLPIWFVWQNVTLALVLKGVFLVTTLFGATPLWMAILADTGASVLVTANALRLLGSDSGFVRGVAQVDAQQIHEFMASSKWANRTSDSSAGVSALPLRRRGSLIGAKAF